MSEPPHTVRRSVSVAVRRRDDAEAVLVVRRPLDDPDLPGVWGLPAASLAPGESWEDAVRRTGTEKLGVHLLIGRELSRGATERAGYTLEMRLFEANIQVGEPAVPQAWVEVTQYVEWRWARADAL